MTDLSDSSRKEAEEIVVGWREECFNGSATGVDPLLVEAIAASLHARELERKRLTALVELLTTAYHNRGNWKGHCSCGLCESLMKAFTSPSLAPLLERRRLELEVIEAARNLEEVTPGNKPLVMVSADSVNTLYENLDRLDAQGKEKGHA